MTNIQLSTHFNSKEFDCKGKYCNCGGNGDKISLILIQCLEQLRSDCGGYPLIVSSSYRCPAHNSSIPGSALNSQHTKWTAADILVPSGLSFEEFKWYVENTVTKNGYKFDGIGEYKWDGFIHLDVRDGGINGGAYRW